MYAVFLSALILSAPLAAQSAEPQQAETGKPAGWKKGDDKLICKSTLDTGSRLRRTRVCMTRWEMKLQEASARRDVDKLRGVSQPAGGPVPF